MNLWLIGFGTFFLSFVFGLGIFKDSRTNGEASITGSLIFAIALTAICIGLLL